MKLDIYQYQTDPPPEPSSKLAYWVEKIKAGWLPNKRISRMGYEERAEFFGVYIWEYYQVLYPLLYGNQR